MAKTQNIDNYDFLNNRTDPSVGLTDAEVVQSRLTYGTNELEHKRKLNLIQKILHVFVEPMFLLLLITASIYFILGEVTDGIIMLVLVLFVSGIEFVQSQKTDKALEALNTLSAINIDVIRNGKRIAVNSKDLVVGDIVLLEEGDKIPADGIIIKLQGLGVNESALTGESAVVYKKLNDTSNNHFRLNMCYAGCDVTNGSAVIQITAVGKNTEYGKIGSALKNIKPTKTPLEKQINKLVIVCTVISLTFCVIVALVNFFYNDALELKERVVQAIISGLTMAMATIPEEIPVVLTVFLAMGAWKLAKHHALTRNMKAVETLGAVTVLCTDKTGTLTQNRMTVQDVFTDVADFPPAVAKSYFPFVVAMACHKIPYDPMEIAIQEYAEKHGVKVKEYNYPLLHEYAFNNEDKMMGQVWKVEGKKILCAKGAYESILPLCHLDSAAEAKVVQQADEFSRQGYRVLAVAMRTNVEEVPEQLRQNQLQFVGLIALSDLPRVGVDRSIQLCRNAGVRVIMITGDNGDTAAGVARQIGLNVDSKIITGAELEKMSDKELEEQVKTTDIFARVYPNHKMRIVKALQSNREVVAMTGDGVNDAPALKKAEIGIAMGQRGTDVAKEAADLILMDDNFSTIVDAIENGRVIYSNIKKAIEYILVIHLPIILASLIIPLAGLPLFLLPIHVVLLELIIDPTSSIIFQRLKPDPDVMNKPPRPLNESLLNSRLVVKCILQGTAMFAVAFAAYYYLIKTGAVQNLATSIAFTTLVLANVFVVYVLQSEDYAIKNFIIDLKDKVIVAINAIIIAVLLAFIYIPFLGRLVGMAPLTPLQLLISFGLAILSTFIFDLFKKPRRGKKTKEKM